MAEQFIGQYIPAGCLMLHTLPRNSRSTAAQDWCFFTRRSDNFPRSLSEDLQGVLLSLPALAEFASLWSRRLIQLALNSEVHDRVRVYVLPRDAKTDMRSSWKQSSKAMSLLFRQLDYSGDCWQGKRIYTYTPQAEPTYQNLDSPISYTSDVSLLTLFNQVPSPDPHPETATDPNLRWAMQSLLESKIPGLTTILQPHQGESAALMLQRETEPGRVVDPRCRPVIDQAGQPWYYDDISGLALKEPRFYDEVRGGILAEKMGTGKTLICLALILSTKSELSKAPEPYTVETPRRKGVASLMDMAAATATRNSVPWRHYFDASAEQGYELLYCKRALTKSENLASYRLRSTSVETHLSGGFAPRDFEESKQVYLSHLTLVIVPGNLVKQWQTEIEKHTTGLSVLVIVNGDSIPSLNKLLEYDIILFSDKRFAQIQFDRQNLSRPLRRIQFKRCVIDERHKLGDDSRRWNNDVMRVLEDFKICARWVVTGMPSRSLSGVEAPKATLSLSESPSFQTLEFDDLQRIKNIATKYLKARPWANAKNEDGDICADWMTYVKVFDRRDCLVNTLNSLLIRHTFSDNVTQRGNLVQFTENMRQACVFGGIFFSAEEITKAVETAEGFLEKKAVPITNEDECLLKQAIAFGKQAANNRLKDISNRFHVLPIYVRDLPGGCGPSWSLDDNEAFEEDGLGLVCTSAEFINTLQKSLNPVTNPWVFLDFKTQISALPQQGEAIRSRLLAAASDAGDNRQQATKTLAGLTVPGNDHHSMPISSDPTKTTAESDRIQFIDGKFARHVAKTRIISTVSAKVSYLVDSITKYQNDEQIIIFYDNDNAAFYLAGVFEALQIRHFICSKAGLSAERRAQYVTTFTNNVKYGVLLMDVSQAAIGLEIRSISRIYFISPVSNPHAVAQAGGHARRVGHTKPVSVETLVLRNSIEEVMVDRREHMSLAEQNTIKSVLDDGKIKEWIRNAKIYPMQDATEGFEQTAPLSMPQHVFGRVVARIFHPGGLVARTPGKFKGTKRAAAPNKEIDHPPPAKRSRMRAAEPSAPSSP
ncbi:hypothetical protein GGR50DRAFT_688850 [Xylaria sp. CBS 124048]|nr:hypothetical protein GGR50DRAFT_688850 [Xylaria sp. CBS 124048]